MKINIVMVARMIEKSPSFVRQAMKQGRLNIGTATEMPSGQWSFDIRPHLLKKYVGDEVFENFLKKEQEVIF